MLRVNNLIFFLYKSFSNMKFFLLIEAIILKLNFSFVSLINCLSAFTFSTRRLVFLSSLKKFELLHTILVGMLCFFHIQAWEKETHKVRKFPEQDSCIHVIFNSRLQHVSHFPCYIYEFNFYFKFSIVLRSLRNILQLVSQ